MSLLSVGGSIGTDTYTDLDALDAMLNLYLLQEYKLNESSRLPFGLILKYFDFGESHPPKVL